MRKPALAVLAISFLSSLLFTATAAADAFYEVTVYNITKGLTFTPTLVASTRNGDRFFASGFAASSELEIIAETGDSAPLAGSLDAYDVSSLGFIGPGGSDTTVVATKGAYQGVSIASMLIPTNDTFFAVNGIDGPSGNKTIAVHAIGYDAGTELNDELCVSLPGPGCGGDPGPASDNGEGYIYVSNGIRGVGDLDADALDFNNPVARITITRIEMD